MATSVSAVSPRRSASTAVYAAPYAVPDPGPIVDGEMNVLPARTLCPQPDLPSDTLAADLGNQAQLLGIDVHQVAGDRPLVAVLPREVVVGPHELELLLGITRSTIYAVLQRAELNRLGALVARLRVLRYE